MSDDLRLEELKKSKETIGQIYPVIKDAKGNILDGFHRKRIDPDWFEHTLPIEDELQALKVRVHLNIMRRKVPESEKKEWIETTRRLLQERGRKGTQNEVARALGLSQKWVSNFDPKPDTYHKTDRLEYRYNVEVSRPLYNVWGFKDESWRQLIIKGDPNQPDKEFYHGATPAFVIRHLIHLLGPRSVLDSMAGTGTTKYVCDQYDIPCDQFDIYPYPKFDVKQGDAEKINPLKTYDLIFNHIPYWRMVKYGDYEDDLSNMNENMFFEKLRRIFQKNYTLLNPNGVYAVLTGNQRYKGKLVPITARTTIIGLETGFLLEDKAIKLTGEPKGIALEKYRAAKHGYLAQAFDVILIFRRTDDGRS